MSEGFSHLRKPLVSMLLIGERNYSSINMTMHSTIFTAAQTPGRNESRVRFNVRSRHSDFGTNEDPDYEDKSGEALAELVKLTWNIWAVSPLFGLDYNDEVKMKQYGKRLRENVASALSQENVSYEAKFTAWTDLVCNPSDPPAVQVEVRSKNDKDDDTKCIYRGIFLAWGPSSEDETESLKLPILLSRGLLNVTQAVHLILSQMFDCVLTAMPASQEDLMWLAVIILDSEDRVESAKSSRQTAQPELTLEYKVPGLPASDLIKVKFPVKSMISLWSKICPSRSSAVDSGEQIASVIKLEQVEKFHECIRIQMQHVASLELGYCLLDAISLPRLTIKSNKMKVMDIGTMDRVLWFFQEKALLFSPTLLPVNQES